MAKILLADDDLSTRQFLSSILHKAGHDVRSCEDGLSAWAAFETSPQEFDLLLTDIVMPGIDGIELGQRARSLYPALKVIYITGFAAMTSASDNTHVISKPFHLGKLTQEIEEILKA